MRRVVSLFLPSWPTDRWRRSRGAAAPGPEVPVVVTGRIGSRKVVLNADAAARALGVHCGIALAQAQARTPGLTIVEAEPQADAAALWVLRRYAPLVAVDGSDGLWLEVAGVAYLLGGEADLLADLTGRLASAGVHAHAALAHAPGAAHGLARFCGAPVIVAGREEEADLVGRLPVGALRIAPETMARRTGQLVRALCDALNAQGLGARTLDLVCERVDGRREVVRIGTAKLNRDPKRLTRLLCDRLDTVDLGSGSRP